LPVEEQAMTTVLPTLVEVNAVQGPPQGQWTYADWEALPEDDYNYEVIEGILYMSTSPSLFHNWIIRRLDYLLGHPVEERGLGYAFIDRAGVLMPGCEPVQPDFVIVLKQNEAILYNRRIRGVPDLIVEVLSPGSVDYDEGVKLVVYAKAGLPQYAVIDPEKRELRLYRNREGELYSEPETFKKDEQVVFDGLADFPVVVSQLFEGAPDTTL
jgi:Uma2 family endonuclease